MIEMDKKPIVRMKHIDEYEVHVEGDSSYYSAKTLAEAKVLVKDVEAKALARWNEENAYSTKRKDYLEFLETNIRSYVKVLSQRLWDLQHKYDPKDVEVIKEKGFLKETIKDLNGFLDESLCVHKAMTIYAKDREEYYVRETKERY